MFRFERIVGLARGARMAGVHLGRRVGRIYKKRILLYTDSRGTNLPGHSDYKHYGEKLRGRFSVDAHYCPEKWTTIPDFLKLMRSVNPWDYAAIVLHAGAVDAAPRHRESLLTRIYPEKRDMLDEIFGADLIQRHLAGDLGCDYEGDKTNNLYSLPMAQDRIIPRLRAIPNLIWIGSNQVVSEWRGNYWKDRPGNIRLIEEYSKVFAQQLPSVIDISDWSPEEVTKFTYDNIHLNRFGSDIVFNRLLQRIEATIESKK